MFRNQMRSAGAQALPMRTQRASRLDWHRLCEDLLLPPVSIMSSEGTEVVLFARERACRVNTSRYWRPGRLPFRNTENGGTRKSAERVLAIGGLLGGEAE